MSLAFRILAGLALCFALLLSTVIPEISNTALLLGMVLSLPVLPWEAGTQKFRPDWRDLVSVLALVALAIALIPTTKSAANYFVWLAILPAGLALPLSRLLAQARGVVTPVLVSSLALVGTGLAACATGYDVFVNGSPRGGSTIMNPIHMGDLALILGFVALTGLFENRSRWRWIFLMGPVLAALAVYWTGSRGPFLALGVVLLIMASYAAWQALPSGARLAAIGSLCVAALALIAFLALSGLYTQVPGLTPIAGLITGAHEVIDESTAQRLQMYRGAWYAFLSSPIFGAGGEDFTRVAARYATDHDLVAMTPHLHADLADFAAIGGIIGLLTYGLLIAAPLLVGFARGPHKLTRSALGLILSSGFFALGLTNAMFGILTLTLTFAVLLAVIMALRTPAPATPDSV